MALNLNVAKRLMYNGDSCLAVLFGETLLWVRPEPFSVEELFSIAGSDGFGWDFQRAETLTSDDAGSVPADVGDPVALVYHAGAPFYGDRHGTQTDAARRPIRTADGVQFDGSNDAFAVSFDSAFTGYLYYASDVGKAMFGVEYPAGTTLVGNEAGTRWGEEIYGLIARNVVFSQSELNGLNNYYNKAGDFNTLTNGLNMFRDQTLTSLPEDMLLTALTNGSFMFRNNGITTLPAGMELNNLTTASSMFENNSLASLPDGMALGALTNGNSVFRSNNLTQLPDGMVMDGLVLGSSMFQSNLLTSLPAGMKLDNLTNGFSMFRGNNLTSLPVSMSLNSLTSGNSMFSSNDFVSIPPGLTLPALTDAASMFRFNYSLTTVPADFATATDCTNWNLAFQNTNLNQASIDLLLNNLNDRGTSNGTFAQTGGSSPSASGEAAVTAMRSRGWTVQVQGGF